MTNGGSWNKTIPDMETIKATVFRRKGENMIVHELKNDVSTVRIHDECYDSNSTRLIGSVSRVISESYKRRYLSQSKESVGEETKKEHQPTIPALRS